MAQLVILAETSNGEDGCEQWWGLEKDSFVTRFSGPFFSPSWIQPALLVAILWFHIDWTFWPTNDQQTSNSLLRKKGRRRGLQ